MCSILYPGPQCSRLGHVLANIQALLANLHWFSVYSICHDANFVAHALARYAKHISSYVFLNRGLSSLSVMETLYFNLAHLRFYK